MKKSINFKEYYYKYKALKYYLKNNINISNEGFNDKEITKIKMDNEDLKSLSE